MKKSILFVCALAITVAMNAIPTQKPRQLVKGSTTPTFRDVTAQLAPRGAKKQLLEEFKDTLYLPYVVPNSYQVGKPDDGLGYDFYGQGLVVRYSDSVTFYRLTDAIKGNELSSSWYLNGEEVAANTGEFKMKTGEFEEFELPVMKTKTLTFNDSTILFEDYQTAEFFALKSNEARNTNKFYNALIVGPAYLKEITPCAMYTDTFTNKYGEDYVRVRAGSLGDYAYGSKLINANLSTTEKTVYMDTIVSLIPNDGVMYIDHLTLAIWTMRDDDNAFPGEGDHARITIYPVSEAGIDWENPLGRATANNDNYTPYAPEYKWLGLLQFDFTTIDPATGAESPTAVIVDGNFAIVLDEINSGTTDFGIFSDIYSLAPGRTFFVYTADGEQRIDPYWNSPSNLLYTLSVLLPAFDGPEEVEFDLAGGSLEFNVPTNVWDDDMEIDADDWITVEMVTDYSTEEYQGQTYYTHNCVNKMKITVSENAAPREGTIEINALGLPITINVIQRTQESAVENIYMRSDNKLYNVLGVEVGEDYKGVVIRNGEKFVR